MKNQLQIIAGEWRSRKLSFPPIPSLRPTPASVRETLFNWLRFDVNGSCCLDLYSGSGALGFEAKSRGAASVVMVDRNRKICHALKQNIIRLDAENIKVLEADVDRYLASSPQPFDLVFIDPPFRQGLIFDCCHALDKNAWLSSNAKIYIEAEYELELGGLLPTNWKTLQTKKAGDVGFHLFKKQKNTNHPYRL